MTCNHCDRPVRARGMCAAHYARWARWGDPLAAGRPIGQPQAFLRNLIGHTGNECVIWPFAKGHAKGYGSVQFDGRAQCAHRVMCILAHGAPDDGMEAAHSCGNRICVNPRHLRWATPASNCADKAAHGTLLQGERVVASKLTADDVREIRRLVAQGHPQKDMAERFGMSRGTVSGIVNGHGWKHIEREAGLAAVSKITEGA